jgi:hypothetical protein
VLDAVNHHKAVELARRIAWRDEMGLKPADEAQGDISDFWS